MVLSQVTVVAPWWPISIAVWRSGAMSLMPPLGRCPVDESTSIFGFGSRSDDGREDNACVVNRSVEVATGGAAEVSEAYGAGAAI